MLKACFKMIYVKGKIDPGPTSLLCTIHSVERTKLAFFMSGLVQLIGHGGFCSMFHSGGYLMV